MTGVPMHLRPYLVQSLIVCACALVLLASSGFAPTPMSNPTGNQVPDQQFPTYTIPDQADLVLAKVVRIIDADTIIVKIEDKTRRYQLLGVDASEIYSKGRTPDPQALIARRFIEQLILGESVYLQHDPSFDRDSASRLAAYIFRAPDMLLVNLELIRQGYAKYNHRTPTLYNDAFDYYQSKAIELNRGIWNPHPETRPEQSFQDQATEPAAIPSDQTPPPDDRVQSVPDNATPIYITKFGKKYHTKDCPHLTESQHQVNRDDLDESYQPCKTCKPDE